MEVPTDLAEAACKSLRLLPRTQHVLTPPGSVDDGGGALDPSGPWQRAGGVGAQAVPAFGDLPLTHLRQQGTF